jgi:hypothetical protein
VVAGTNRGDVVVATYDDAAEALSDPGAALDALMVRLDTSGRLTSAAAAMNAATFARMASCRPGAPLSFCVPDFDDDPRALPDIPEARAFIRDFAHALARLDPGDRILRRLLPESALLVGLCTGVIPRSAVEFTPWVFEEVLPSIRRTGSYVGRPPIEETDDEFFARAVVRAQAKLGSGHESELSVRLARTEGNAGRGRLGRLAERRLLGLQADGSPEPLRCLRTTP